VWILGALTIDVVLPALTVSGGLAAAIFTALRFNRDDATAIVGQQRQVLDSMKALNDELAEALDRARADRAATLERNLELEKEVTRYKALEEGRSQDA
jgi:predicted phage gp36 major capsid-like protein